MKLSVLILIVLLIAIVGGALGYFFGAGIYTALFFVFALVLGFYIGMKYKIER